MANAIYPATKEAMWGAGAGAAAGTVKAALVDTGTYTYSSAHDFYNDVSGVVGTPQTLGSKTFTNGLFDAADMSNTAVSGNSIEAIIIYVDTGTPSTSRLLLYLDTSVTGLPVTPNGGDINTAWNASGICQL